MPKKDKIDWKDDFLVGIQLAIAVIMGFLFYNYIESNPSVSDALQPAILGRFIISFGIFIGIFLFIRWLDREKV